MNRGSPVQPAQPSLSRANLRFSLTVIVLIGAALRFLPLGASTFPLNDGGLFARMADDIAANGFLLPAFTSYNGEAIPFAYPPLGLYLTAAFGQVLGRDAADILRWLPAALSTASVLALYLAAAELLRSRWRGAAAAAAFALMPRSYMWLIVGGGITRALGLLLALLALHQGILMLRRGRPAYIAGTAAFGGLTVLAHPQAAVFLTISLLTLLVFHAFSGRAAASFGRTALAGVGGLIVASPWLFAVITVHGLPTLLAAARTGFDPANGAGQLLGLAFTDSPVLDLLSSLGVLGVLVRIARRQWMVPTWLLLTVFIDPRAGATYATVPLAFSVVPILGEILSRMIAVQENWAMLASSTTPARLRRYPAAAILALLILFVALRTASRTAVSEINPLHGLQAAHVSAMGWVREHAPANATFAVVTNRYWEGDYLSEWFPALTLRTSVATVQGSEWSGFRNFIDRLAMFRQLQDCASGTVRCIDEWIKGWRLRPPDIFIPKGQLFGPTSPDDCCPALRETLAASADYRVIYDGPGATIFEPAGH